MRRALPLGGQLKEDYAFDEGFVDEAKAPRKVRFSELFQDSKNTLVIYNYMFAPTAQEPCPMCTSFVDSLVGAVPHLEQRINVALVARAPIDKLLRVARDRTWITIRLLSSYNNTFNSDYNAERTLESQMPVLSVFRRIGNAIYHFYSTEMLYFSPDPGQNPRHLDIMWPLWNILDMVPEGRGAGWFPSLSYP